MASYSESHSQLRLEAQRRLPHKNMWGLIDETMDQSRLVHELQVHQIELEIQNEELVQTLTEVNALRAKYLALYDFAPVGYFTLDTKGNILELNLRAAKMLGQERTQLVGRPLREFFDPQTLPRLNAFLTTTEYSHDEVFAQALQSMRSKSMLLPMYMNAQARAFVDPQTGQKQIRLVLMDVTALKTATDDVVRIITHSASASA
jgi:PAS domain S-box-containing protein